MRKVRLEFTNVTVTVVMDGDNIVLTPSDDTSREQLEAILDADESRRLWNFMGSRYNDSRLKDLFIGAHFACGGERYKKREGNVISTDYTDAIKVYLDLNETEDTQARYAVRNFGYFSGGMVVLDESTADRVVLGPKSKCKVCEGPLARFIELEWKVCNTCHETCEHEYKEGVGQANGHIAWLSFCTKCGRGDPNWKPSDDPVEDIVKAVTEGRLTALVLESGDGTTVISNNNG